MSFNVPIHISSKKRSQALRDWPKPSHISDSIATADDDDHDGNDDCKGKGRENNGEVGRNRENKVRSDNITSKVD